MEKDDRLDKKENLPRGWSEITLVDYVYIAARIGWKGLKRSEYTTVGPLLLAVKDINENGSINFSNVTDHLSKFRYDESPNIKLCENDILITKDGTIGKVGHVDDLLFPTTVNSSILVVRPVEAIFSKYLFYYFKAPFFQNIVKNKIKGIAIPHLFQYDIKKFQLRISPLNEQKRIVSKIESIFTQIDAAKESLVKIKVLIKQARQSVLKSAFEGTLVPQDPKDESAEILLKKIHGYSKKELVFEKDNVPKGWIRTNLENVVEILDGKRIPINFRDREQRKGNIPYYGATMQVGWINDHIFDDELVLLGEDGAPFFEYFKNKAYIINGKSWVNNHAHVLKGIPKILINRYLCHYLNQFDYHGYVSGTTRLKLNQTFMKTIPIILASINEQKRIVSKIESIFGKIDAIERSFMTKIIMNIYLNCLI